jgi:hypothetical protein
MLCQWATSKAQYSFDEGEVELNAFVQSFQSGTECGQIGLVALVLAEKASDAVFDANLADWMRQFDHRATVQAINIVRFSNTRSKMFQLLKDFGLD